jgi:hypothetical protein
MTTLTISDRPVHTDAAVGARPSPMLVRQLTGARRAIDSLARQRPLTLAAVNERIAALASRCAAGRGNYRTLPVHIEAATLAYCWEAMPHTWRYDADRVGEHLDSVAPSLLRTQATFGAEPRLAWTTDDGRLVVDEIHYTHLRDGLLDDWMRPRVAGSARLGLDMAGADFAGVRVLSLYDHSRSLLATPHGEVVPLSGLPLDASCGLWR